MSQDKIPPTDYMPDVAIPPGETIKEMLKERGMSQYELAQRIGLPSNELNEVIKGEDPITVDLAFALALEFGIPASFWLNLEKNYRATLARLEQA